MNIANYALSSALRVFVTSPDTPAPGPVPSLPRKRRRWRRWAYEGIFALAVFTGIQAYMARGAAGGMAPALAGLDLAQQPLSLKVPSSGPTVVHFWATWCGICGAMDDNVAALAENYNVISVALSSGTAAEIDAHLRGRELVLPVLQDADGALSRSWGVRGVPTTFFLDASGRIQNVTVGYSTRLGLHARAWRAGRATPGQAARAG
jgi:thiol-disulfide isomerase/thioredoxin